MRLIWKKLSNAPYRKKKLIDEQQLSFEGSLRIHIVVWHRTAEDSCMKRMPKIGAGQIGDAHQPEFICRRQLYEAYAEIRVPGNLQRFYSAENELERSQLDLAPV